MTQMMTNKISLQVEDNSPSMEHHRTHPMFVSWFLSVITRPPKCPKAITIILHIINFVICSPIVACDVADNWTINSYFKRLFESEIYNIIFDAKLNIEYVSLYYYGYHSIKQYKKWLKLMSKMENLDQQISKETPMNDRPIKIVKVLVILATFGPLFLIIPVYYYFYEICELNGYYIYMLAQLLINSFIFDVIVYVLYHRFRTINKLIMQLDKQFNKPLITSKIRYIRRLHNEICDAVIMVNNIQGFYLLFFSTHCIIIVVAKLPFIYVYTQEHDEFVLRNNIWIFCTAQFGVTCWICTLVHQESENTKVIISTIALNCNDVNFDNQNGTRNQSNVEVPSENQDSEHNSNRSISNNESHNVSNRDRDVKNEINNFSIQLQQHRVAITACNFFEINNALFSRFVGVIISYLVIFVQCSKPYNTMDTRLEEHFGHIYSLLNNISLQLSDTAIASQNETVTLLQQQ